MLKIYGVEIFCEKFGTQLAPKRETAPFDHFKIPVIQWRLGILE